MTKKFSFGKIDGYHNGKKSCEVTLEFGFREFENQEPYFTACVDVWNNLHTDIIRGGQCLDYLFNEYKSLRHNRLFNECYTLWKGYHLKPISQIPAEIVDEINNVIANGEQDNFVVKY